MYIRHRRQYFWPVPPPDLVPPCVDHVRLRFVRLPEIAPPVLDPRRPAYASFPHRTTSGMIPPACACLGQVLSESGVEENGGSESVVLGDVRAIYMLGKVGCCD